MSEDWQRIPAFPKYLISSMGRVQNSMTERILHPSKNQEGHLKVNLTHQGEVQTRTVNHLLLEHICQTLLDATSSQ